VVVSCSRCHTDGRRRGSIGLVFTETGRANL
jgi:hypothetical protein